MAEDKRMQSGILGDINPKPGTEEHVASKKESAASTKTRSRWWAARSTIALSTRARARSPKA